MTNSFGIYAHIPYCYHRCSYCDFFSSTQFENKDFDRLFQALQSEWSSAKNFLEHTQRKATSLRSVFLGGGTPSLAPPSAISSLLGEMLPAFEGAPEVTLEANPETVTLEKVKAWKSGGVNRVSMGAQSFQPSLLKALERVATPESIGRAVGYLHDGGISEFSLDLIFGIPGQSLELMRDDLEKAVALEPGHISFYSLTLKPGHALYSQLPSDDESAELFEAGIEFLRSRGYPQYEISNFAKPGKESRHNLLYWDGGDFLGIGPSAASRFFWDGRFHHRKQVSDLKRYFENLVFPAPGFEITTARQTVLEAVFLELRKNEGVSISHFRDRYGYDLRSASKLTHFLKHDLIRLSDDLLQLTDQGRLLADSVTSELLD